MIISPPIKQIQFSQEEVENMTKEERQAYEWYQKLNEVLPEYVGM